VAILPTVALLGVGIGNLLSGAVFAEIVFARAGIGKLIYDSVLNRNYPVVMGAVLVTTMLYVHATLIAALVAALLDPRVRTKTSLATRLASLAGRGRDDPEFLRDRHVRAVLPALSCSKRRSVQQGASRSQAASWSLVGITVSFPVTPSRGRRT
jgi:hypothetical protein